MGEELGHGLPPGKMHLPPDHKEEEELNNNKYELHNQTLATVTSAKYLGVTIHQGLSCDKHVTNVCFKSKKPKLPRGQTADCGA